MARTRDRQGRSTSSNGHTTPADRIVSAVLNAAFSRSYFSRQYSHQLDGPRRDVDDECGYPATSAITAEKLQEMYDREPVASRVVELWPMECWRASPAVYEDDDPNRVTDFEEAWDGLGTRLTANWRFGDGGKPERVSWFRSEEGSPVWDLLRRADILSGIGYYGGIFLGFDDVGTGEKSPQLSDPVQPSPDRDLLFARPLSQKMLRITSVESDVTNPRYGLPASYSVSLGDPEAYGDVGVEVQTVNVHWSRVVHLADDRGDSEVYATPRQRPVWNRLMDLRKIHGGSAEAFWLQVVRETFFELDPALAGELGGNVEVDLDDMRDAVEKMKTGLQRWMLLKGMRANSIGPQVVDPNPHVDAAVTAICIRLGVPKRIFMGSERGELASSQDQGSWNSRVLGRQVGYLTPKLIVPFADRLIMAGVLPEPEEYTVVWPDEEHLTQIERAQLGHTRTQTITEYVQKGGEQLMTPMDFYTRVIGMTEEEAETVLDNVNKVDEDERLTMEKAAEPDSGEAPPDEEEEEGEEPPTGEEPPEGGPPREARQQPPEPEEEPTENSGTDEYGSWEVVPPHQYSADGEQVYNAETKKIEKLNQPFRTPGGPKKFGVYVKNPGGNVVLVRFGDPDMEIKRDDPERRRNFRARHGCDDPGPRYKPRYWSCRMWSNESVEDVLNEDD